MKKLLLAGAMFLASITASLAADPVKVGFIYVGPIGDHGWTYRHDIGRQQVEEAFGDKVETSYIESVQYGPEAENVIRQMAEDHDIIFATSLDINYLGMIFVENLPRSIDIDTAIQAATICKEKNIKSVGVFLNQNATDRISGFFPYGSSQCHKSIDRWLIECPFSDR